VEHPEVVYECVTSLRYRACPKCAARMLLKSIDPDMPGHDKRTFECVECRRKEFVVIKFRDSFQSEGPRRKPGAQRARHESRRAGTGSDRGLSPSCVHTPDLV
jgi:hypothetical protein